MFLKILKLTLAVLLLVGASARQALAGGAAQDSASRRAEKAREKIAKFSRVEVKLADGTRLKGSVAGSDEEGFTLEDKKGVRTRVSYSQVASVKRVRQTSAAKDIGVLAGVVGTIVITLAVALSQPD